MTTKQRLNAKSEIDPESVYMQISRIHEIALLQEAEWIVDKSYYFDDAIAWMKKHSGRLVGFSLVKRDYKGKRDYGIRMREVSRSMHRELVKKYIDRFKSNLLELMSRPKEGHRGALSDTIFRAKAGEVKAIKKLIQFDRLWLNAPWMSALIAKARGEDDQAFFRMYSDASRLKIKSRNKRKKGPESKVYELAEGFSLLRHWFGASNEFYGMVIDFLYELVYTDEVLGSSPGKIPILESKEYGIKYLKRHAA